LFREEKLFRKKIIFFVKTVFKIKKSKIIGLAKLNSASLCFYLKE
jgi:hypothetical protein